MAVRVFRYECMQCGYSEHEPTRDSDAESLPHHIRVVGGTPQ
jgi:hypothetical protein